MSYYVVAFNATEIYGPSMTIDRSKAEAVESVATAISVMLGALGDWQAFEWRDDEGNVVPGERLLHSADEYDTLSFIEQINHIALTNRLGYIRFSEYDDLLTLIKGEQLEARGSDDLKQEIARFKVAHAALMERILKECNDG